MYNKDNYYYKTLIEKNNISIIDKQEGKILGIKNNNLIIQNNEIIKIYDSISEASRENNISKGNIIQTCKGFRKHAGGFKWSYIENLRSDVI